MNIFKPGDTKQAADCSLLPVRRVGFLKLHHQTAAPPRPSEGEAGRFLIDEREGHTYCRHAHRYLPGLEDGDERLVIRKVFRRRVAVDIEGEGYFAARYFGIVVDDALAVLEAALVFDKVFRARRKEEVFDEAVAHRYAPLPPGILAVDV